MQHSQMGFKGNSFISGNLLCLCIGNGSFQKEGCFFHGIRHRKSPEQTAAEYRSKQIAGAGVAGSGIDRLHI